MSQKLQVPERFTDADYIDWSDRPTWTAREAIAALYGYRSGPNVDELVDLACERETLQHQFHEFILETRFPDQEDKGELKKREHSREVLDSFRNYDDIPEKFRTPPKWVQRASYGSLKIAREWQAIFPHNFKMRLGVSLQHEPDYREFIDSLTRNLEIFPRELVCYALNVHPDRFEQTPACGDLLVHIYSHLWAEIEFSDIQGLRNSKITVSWFSDHCQAYNYLFNARYISWQSWINQHSELVSHLSGIERSSRPPKFDPILQAAIDKLFPELVKQTFGGLLEHFRQNGADAVNPGFEGLDLGVDGCEQIYLDGDSVVWISAGREYDIKLTSLQRYFYRSKKVELISNNH